MNLSGLSTEDLLALRAGDLGRVSTRGLLELKRQQAAADPQAQQTARAAAQAEPVDNSMGMGRAELLAAGAGKAFNDAAMSVRQGANWLGNKVGVVSDADYAKLQAELDEQARIDRRLMDNGWALAGNVAGQVGASLLPVAGQLNAARAADALWKAGGAANIARSLGTAAGLGAAQNVVMNPRTGDNSLLGQAATGGALGAGGQLLAPALSAGVQFGRQLLAGPQGQAGRAIGTAASAGRPPDAAAMRALAELIQRNATEIVPGSLPTAVQAADNAGISQLARTVANRVQGGALAGRAADQNAARMAYLSQVGDIGADSVSARTAAGDVLMDRMAPVRSASSANVSGLYQGVDPFHESRLPLPITYVDEVVDTYFGPGAGAMPAELRSLVDDVRMLGTVTTPSTVPGVVDWRTMQNLRSRASEAARKLGLSGDKRAAAVAQQIRDSLDATAEEVAGRVAMRQALDRGTDAPSAMFRKGLGEIDFPWGKVGKVEPGDSRPTGGFGVSHLVAGRNAQGFDGQAVAMTMPELLARGKVGAPYGPAGARRVNVSLGDDAQAVLSQGAGNHWLLTGWNDGAPGVRPVVHSVTDYTPGPSVIQNQGGAGAAPIVGAPGEFFAPDMAQALRAARQAKIEHEARFGTGPSRLLFKDGPDGTPRLQGAQRFDAFFNASAKQREAVEQLNRMTQGDADIARAFRGGAITDLVQSATNKADELSLPKYERWVEQRSEALKGLLDREQLGKVRAVLMDLKRADKAANAGRAIGSNTAQNLAGDSLLGGVLLDALASKVPYAGPWVAGSMRDAQRNRMAGLLDAILADPTRTAGALDAYAGLLNPNLLQRSLAFAPAVANPLAGGLLGALQSQPGY